MTPEFTNILTQTIIPALSTILIALVSWATAMAVQWINEHTKGKRAQRATLLMRHLENAVDATVTTANETLVKALKEKGKFSAEEQAAVKQAVMDSVKRQSGPIIKELTDMGVTEINEILHNRIEQAVKYNKPSSEVVAAR